MVSRIDRIGRALDRVIGLFSPQREARRRYFRERNAMYAAAKTTRLTGAWNPANVNVNTLIQNSNPTIKGRVRQLVRDFPYFKRAVSVLVNHTTPMQFQSRVRDENGRLNKKLNTKIEDAHKRWADEADIARKLHFYEVMSLEKRQDVESGEFLLVKRQLTGQSARNRYIPYVLQLIEADWLTGSNDHYGISNSKTEIRQGIEYDIETGEVLKYHITDPDNWKKTQEIPAENVVHGFETLRPGQLRGVSPFAAAVLTAHDLNDMMDAELDAAKLASKWLAFVETPDPSGFQAARGATTSDGKTVEELENAIIEYLRPGEKFNAFGHNRPNAAFEPYVCLILRMVAVSVDVPYEFLAEDYRGISYSNHKGIRNDFTQHLRPICFRHVTQFCDRVWKPAMDWLVLTGKLELSGYWKDPWFYWKHVWMPPGMAPIDPLKEGRADADAVTSLLKSPQEITMARGRDYEDVLEELAEAKRMQEERGLLAEPVSNSTTGNPAALMDEDNEKSYDEKPLLRLL